MGRVVLLVFVACVLSLPGTGVVEVAAPTAAAAQASSPLSCSSGAMGGPGADREVTDVFVELHEGPAHLDVSYSYTAFPGAEHFASTVTVIKDGAEVHELVTNWGNQGSGEWTPHEDFVAPADGLYILRHEITQIAPSGLIPWDFSFEVEGGCSPFEDETCICDPSPAHGSAGRPVSTLTGSFYEEYVDLQLGGRNPLGFARRYDSMHGFSNEALGSGWTHSYSDHLDIDPPMYTYRNGSGGPAARFYSIDDQFVAPARFDADLETVTVGNTFEYRMTTQDGTFRAFDPDGRLLRVEDRFGIETFLDYDGDQLVRVGETDTVGDGRELRLEWGTPPGFAIERLLGVQEYVEGVPGREVTYSYDPNNAGVVESVDVEGNATRYRYDVHGRMVGVRDPNQVAALVGNPNPPAVGDGPGDLKNTYDSVGRVVAQRDPSGAVTEFEYDTPVGGATTVTFPEVSVTRSTGASYAQTAERVDYYEDNRRVRVDYGATTSPGNVTPDYTLSLGFEYDELSGGLTKVTNLATGRVLEERIYYQSGGSAGLLKSVRSAGATAVTSFANYDSFGQPGTVTSPLGVATTFTHDEDTGRLEGVSSPIKSPEGTSLGTYTESYLYDDAGGFPGDLVRVIDARGKTWQFDYDDYGFLAWEQSPTPQGAPLERTTYDFDPVGRLVSVRSPKGDLVGNDPAKFTTTFTTDALGRVETASYWGRSSSAAAPALLTVERTYDPNGNVKTMSDAEDHMTTFGYDPANRPTLVERADGTDLVTTYYEDGSVKATIDAAQNATTSYVYDELGRVLELRGGIQLSTVFTYNADGLLSQRQSPGGSCATNVDCVTYAYDQHGRTTSVNYTGTTPDVTAIGYDAAGRRTSMTDGTGTTLWRWDSRGALLSQKTDGPDRTVSYVNDAAGNVTSITYPNGWSVTRGYDEAGRWTSVTDWDGRTFEFAPDENGNYDHITFPSGRVDNYVFDEADRLVNQTVTTGGTTWPSLGYERFPDGALKKTTTSGLPGPATESYTYTDIDQLAGVGSASYDYDDAGNLTSMLDGSTQVFDDSNRLCHIAPAGQAVTPPTECAHPSPGGSSTPVNNAWTEFDYDARGNRIWSGPENWIPSQSTFAYDLENRLVAASTPVEGNDGKFTPADDARLMDTRPASQTGVCSTWAGNGPCTTLGANAFRTLQVTGQGGIPASGVSSVVLTVTAVDAAGNGRLSVWPSDEASENATAVNYQSGETVSNTVFAKVSSSGRVIIKALDAGTDVVVDVQGWFSSPTGAGTEVFSPIAQTPIVDTRPATRSGLCPTASSQCVTLPANGSLDIQVTGQGGVPALGGGVDVAAVAVNVIATDPTTGGRIKVWKAGDPEPAGTAGPRFAAGETTSLTAVVELSDDGRITLMSTGATDVVVEVQGWFNADFFGKRFHAMSPMRLLDTRTPQIGACPDTAGQCTRLTAGSTRTVQVAGRAGLPTSGINAVVVNVIATGASGDGHLVAHASGGSGSDDGRVYFSSSSAIGATVIVPVSLNGRITIGAVDADTDVVIEVQGYFSNAWNASSYTYDGTGLRASKTTTDGRAEFSWDRSGGLPSLLVEHDGVSESIWIYGPGGIPLEQLNPNGVVMFLHHDQLGSIRTITSPQGWEIGEFAYDPYGNVTHATGTARTPFGYAGQYTDFETGNQYLRARYYDPSTGQFLTRDPIEAITGDAYGYVYGNPLNYTDPTGLFTFPGTDICVDVMDNSCTSIKEQHPIGAQEVANTAGGVLEGVSLGNAATVMDAAGIYLSGSGMSGNMDLDSAHAIGGYLAGLVLITPLAIHGGSTFGTFATYAGIGSAGRSCYSATSAGACAQHIGNAAFWGLYGRVGTALMGFGGGNFLDVWFDPWERAFGWGIDHDC